MYRYTDCFDEDDDDWLSETINELFSGMRVEYEGSRNDNDFPGTYGMISCFGTPPATTQQVKISSIDFQAKANAANHHCEKYQLLDDNKNISIIRRGGNFTLDVTFSTEVDLNNKHLFKYDLLTGARSNVHNGTRGALVSTGKTKFDKDHLNWDMRIAGKDGKKVTFEIQVPTNAPIGLWKSAFQVMERADSSSGHTFRPDHSIYILFNPWNKNDDTYLPDEKERQEYILNDHGYIWKGFYQHAHAEEWAFGQFDVDVLPTCVLLLERAGINPRNRGNPVLISRGISKIVNSDDDNGVLEGKWGEPYTDGITPTAWTGSVQILKMYRHTNRKVRYGQCWVFAAVANTVCRALGLPARVVTNFESGHDADESLTINQYYSNYGGDDMKVVRDSEDSIWNFHVWNEVWMARSDLPEGYGGWQIIDATPQETSDGVFQCGPASLEAVRRGHTHLKYDVGFVLAEVNADVVHWEVDHTATYGFKQCGSNTYCIGKQVLTTAPSDTCWQSKECDVTCKYKPQEGTKEERDIYLAARKRQCPHFKPLEKMVQDVQIAFKAMDKVHLGRDFSTSLVVRNVSNAPRNVHVRLQATSIYYNRRKANVIKTAETEMALSSKQDSEVQLHVPYETYYPKLVTGCIIKILAICNIKETNQTLVDFDMIELKKANMKVEIPPKTVIFKSFVARFSFPNPLRMNLTKCSIVMEAPGLLRPKKIPVRDVGPMKDMEYSINIHPRRPGEFKILAKFNSEELYDISGSAVTTVGWS